MPIERSDHWTVPITSGHQETPEVYGWGLPE